MSVFDRFLSAIKMNDDEPLEDDAYLDEETDEEFGDDKASTRLIRRSWDEDEDTGDGVPAPAQSSSVAVREPAAREQSRESRPARRETRERTRERERETRDRASARAASRAARRGDAASSAQVCIIRPRSIEDGSKITDTLLENCTVILNLEGLDLQIAQRVMDYTFGSCYALNGKLQKISMYIYVVTPASVDISGDFTEVLTGAFDIGTF